MTNKHGKGKYWFKSGCPTPDPRYVYKGFSEAKLLRVVRHENVIKIHVAFCRKFFL